MSAHLGVSRRISAHLGTSICELYVSIESVLAQYESGPGSMNLES